MKSKKQINKFYPSIKLGFNFSNKKINFLDNVVYKTYLVKLETKLYRKTSEHPELLKRSIPFEAYHLRTIIQEPS